MAAASRQHERAERRRLADLSRRLAERERMAEMELASVTVETYQAQLEVLRTIHQECGEEIEWDAIAAATPPAPPKRATTNEDAARFALEQYRPGFFDRLLGWDVGKRRSLEENVAAGRESDGRDHAAAVAAHAAAHKEWESDAALARRVLARDVRAYLDVARDVSPLAEIAGLGTEFTLKVDDGWPDRLLVQLHVRESTIVPKEIPNLTARGKLTTKAMPKGTANEIYQDYVCGAILRVGRELFAALPLDVVLVDAITDLLNPATGHVEEQPIVAVALTRAGMQKLNFASLDPSDSFRNFTHRMKFKKGSGLAPVAACAWDEIPSAGSGPTARLGSAKR